MLLYHVGVLGLGQDLEQLVVRKEPEPREELPLDVEVLGQGLLDLLQALVVVLELLLELVGVDLVVQVVVLVELLHVGPPGLIDQHELLVLLRHLGLDVLRVEDRLQVHPPSLADHPLVQGLLDQQQLVLQAVGLVLDRLDEGVRFHHAQRVRLVVQVQLDLIQLE